MYSQLDQTAQYQIQAFDAKDFEILKWFISGDLEQHIAAYICHRDLIPFKLLNTVKQICEKQGVPRLFPRFIIKHYAQSNSFSSAKNRFDECLSHYLSEFECADFIELIDAINKNRQIYGYGWQKERNDKILEYALPLLPENFDFENYPHFEYSKPADDAEVDEIEEVDNPGEVPESDPELPF